MKPITLYLAFSVSLLAQHVHEMPAAHETPAAQGPVDLLKDSWQRPVLLLQDFERLALAQNPTLLQAESLVKQSAASARQAGLYPNPSVGYQGEQIRGGSYGGGEQGAFLQQTFILGGKLGLRRNVYEQQRQADAIGVDEQRNRVLSNVGQDFYAALAAQELVHLRQRLLTLANDALTTAHQLANVGQADAPDVLQAEVEAEQAGVEYSMAQRVYIQDFTVLATLVGKPELPLGPLKGDLERPPAVDAEQVVERIIQESPAVKRARQQAILAQSSLKSARRESVPDLQVRGGVEQNSERLHDLTGPPVGAQAFASASVSVPIFNRNQGNVAAARVAVERAEAEVKRVQLLLRQSSQTALQTYLANRNQAERYRDEMIPRATRAYQLYLAKYRQMGAAYPQVLVSQRTLFQLQVAYISALETVWRNVIALQHYTLSSGLDAPVPSGSLSVTTNVPGSTMP